MILVRPRAWWYSKVPLSITLVLLLLDGYRLSADALAVLLLVPLSVAAMGNYGYAVNELFDVDEDARVGRANVAAGRGRRYVALIALGSALAAVLFATLAAGAVGAVVTGLELCLPLVYSVPPVRLKEQGWLGAASDALAAHVYPAVLALLAVGQWNVRAVAPALSACVIAWAAAVGLRGILSHQLQAADSDRRAGLRTVVHDLGAARLERFTIWVVLPIEAAAFGAALVLADTGALLWGVVVVYLVCEAFKVTDGSFTVTAFRRQGQRYLPLVDENFYKVWGPLALACDAARVDVLYLLVIPAFALAFPLHLLIEWRRLGALGDALRSRVLDVRSSGGS